MKKVKRLKTKRLINEDIESYCKSVEKTLTKISERCEHKESKKKK